MKRLLLRMTMMPGCRQRNEVQEAKSLALIKFSILDVKSIVQRVQEQEKETMIIGCKQKQQQARVLVLDKYCVLDIETKVQEIQEEEALWTDFVYEEEGKDVELKNLGAKQSKKIASKAEAIKEEASVSSQAQDPLEEVNLGEGSI